MSKKKNILIVVITVAILVIIGVATSFGIVRFARQNKNTSEESHKVNDNVTNKVEQERNKNDNEEETKTEQKEEEKKEEENQNEQSTLSNSSTASTPNTNNTPTISSLKDAVNSTSLNPVVTRYDKVDKQITAIINNIITPGMSNYDKLVAIYNYVIQNTEYYTGDIEYNINEMKREVGYLHYYYRDMLLLFQGLDVLENKSGVCFNYSALLLMLGRRVGFDIYTVSAVNTEGGAHTFNVIKAGGNYYILDSQGDDGGSYSLNYYFGKPLSQSAGLYRLVNGINPFYYFAEDESYVEPNAIITIGDVTIKSSADTILEDGSNRGEYTIQVGKTIGINTDTDSFDTYDLISSFTITLPDGTLDSFSYTDQKFSYHQNFYPFRKVGDYHITFELKNPIMGDYAIVGFIVHVVE